MVNALKSINISIPEDTLVCGFDGSLEAKIIVPQLTTITIPSYDMGNLAAELIISRIKDNSTPFKTVHVKTSIDYRESTGFILYRLHNRLLSLFYYLHISLSRLFLF